MRGQVSPLQREILLALAQPDTRLRWHAVKHRDRAIAGRGLVMGLGGSFRGDSFTGGPIASYTVRKLVEQGHVQPVDQANARPFLAGDPPYRDYSITRAGRFASTKATT